MNTGNENPTDNREKEVRAIGAFCTDIQGSVDRVDTYGDKAFKHHAAYIEKVAETYGHQLKIHKGTKVSTKMLLRNSHFWIPGDALWGVVLEEPGQSIHDSMITAFARVLNACAAGLVEAHNKALELQIAPLEIRGAMMAGQVLVKELIDLNSFLYSGSSLNACGRLQGKAASNSITLGFVFPTDEPGTKAPAPPVTLNIGSPEIQVKEISDCLNKLKLKYPELSLCKPGCKLNFETVISGEGKKFLRFCSLPEKIRGLKRCEVIITRVRLELDENQGGIHLDNNSSAHLPTWARSTVKLENNPGTLYLSDLVARAPDCNFTLPGVYQGDNIVIHTPQTLDQDFILDFKGDQYRPRAGLNREKVTNVDFKKYRFCCLPVFSISNRDTDLLIKSSIDRKKKSLVLHEIPDRLNNEYRDLSGFIDSAGECAEFIFD